MVRPADRTLIPVSHDLERVLGAVFVGAVRTIVRDEVCRALEERKTSRPRVFTLAETQSALSLSRATVARMVARADLSVVRVGRRVLVPATEVERLLAAGRER